MSDHLDGVTARQQPQLDISDFYLRQGPNNSVVGIINVNPLSGAGGFHHDGIYQFSFSLDGGTVPGLVFRAEFGEADASGHQAVTLRLATGKAAATPGGGGVIVATGRTGSVIAGAGGIQLFAGAAGDPFFIEGSVVTAVATAVQKGAALDLSGFDSNAAHNLFAGTNVQTIVIQVPVPRFGAGRRIGAWAETWVPLDDGSSYRRIDRAANPLVSTIYGFAAGDDFNAAGPEDDAATYGPLIRSMTANVVAANAATNKITNPQAYAATVAAALLPDILYYTVGTDAYWYAQPPPGQQYARNGRDLVGNHPEQMFELVLGMPVPDGLTAADATGTLRPAFPYLSEPA
jgi:uncharacterized protein DUF4331